MSSLFKLHRETRVGPEVSSPEPVDTVVAKPERALALREVRTEQVNLKPETRLIFHTEPKSVAADRYRHLRMRLRELRNTAKLKTLLVTSPLPADGKSTTALNLATALGERGRFTVLLIEADLYRSPVVDMLGIQPGPGLAECIEFGLDPAAAIRRLEPLGWFVLPAGTAIGNPTELLQTEAFAQIMQKLVPCFDWVLIDSPPVIPLVDALLLKQHANATLLVARAGHTPRAVIEKSLSLLGREHVAGVVLNAVEGLNRLYSKYSGYYGYYGSKTTKSK